MIRRIAPSSRYFVGSLLDRQERYSLMTWWLPFVTPEPLRSWRLPQRYFQPQTLLVHAWSQLTPGGLLFIVNQGGREDAAQRRLLDQANISASSMGELSSIFSPYRRKRYGWLIEKPRQSAA